MLNSLKLLFILFAIPVAGLFSNQLAWKEVSLTERLSTYILSGLIYWIIMFYLEPKKWNIFAKTLLWWILPTLLIIGQLWFVQIFALIMAIKDTSEFLSEPPQIQYLIIGASASLSLLPQILLQKTASLLVKKIKPQAI